MAAGGRRTCRGCGEQDGVKVGSGAEQHLPKPSPPVGPPHQPAPCLSFSS